MGKKNVSWTFLGIDNNCYKCLKHYLILNNEVVCGQHWTADNCPWPLSCIAVFQLSVSNRHSFLLYTISRFKALLTALSPIIISLRQLSAELHYWIQVFVWGNGITSQYCVQGQKIIGHVVLFWGVIVVWCVKTLFRGHERGICVVELQYSSVQIWHNVWNSFRIK